MKRRSAWIFTAGVALLLGACGSEESKMERGAVVDREVAVPQSKKELGMTEQERRAAEQAQEEKKEDEEDRLFDESEQK